MDKFNLLPDNAKRVFKGQIFEIYQWRQELFDGSTAIFEEAVRPDTALIIPIIDQKIIINTEEQPGRGSRTDFIMGRVEENEEADAAALRELNEELGIKPRKLFHLGSDRITHKILWWSHVYIALDVVEKNTPKLDPGEQITNIELSFDAFYDKCKKLEITVPRFLIRFLLDESKEDFIDRFTNPEKYFTEIQI